MCTDRIQQPIIALHIHQCESVNAYIPVPDEMIISVIIINGLARLEEKVTLSRQAVRL
jgi:hypothetical protein